MIKLEKVSKIYSGGITALRKVDLRIEPKEFVTLVGPSGSGKSTLIKLIIREENPSEGKIFVGNQDILTLKPWELPFLRRRIGIVFQDFKLLREKTAYENIAFAMEMCGLSTSQIMEDVPNVLKIVGLLDKADHFPHQLSGGEQQRIALARALIHRPDILIADEPTGNLDPINTWEIIQLLMKINELGTTLILATHNKEMVNLIKKRVVTIKDGQIVRDEEEGKYIL